MKQAQTRKEERKKGVPGEASLSAERPMSSSRKPHNEFSFGFPFCFVSLFVPAFCPKRVT
jgi:hypothetical protein